MPQGKLKKDGRKDKSIEIVKEMLKRKLDVDLICEITKLTREEINNISKEK